MMQNQNVQPWPWVQGSAPPFQASQAIMPPSFSSSGLDQNPLVPGFHQLYSNSSVQSTDFGQWSSTHLQQWQQWHQWQEKYQQWQIQYGKKYAESLVATGQNPNVVLPNLSLPQSFVKTEKSDCCSTPAPVPAPTLNPPLPPNSLPPPPPPDEEKPPLPISGQENKMSTNYCTERKDGLEELSDAEKTFDVQFKQWEGQFNEWKKENQDHPDKAQYKEYEKKWEAWREQLLQRREQMRKKRLGQTSERKTELSNTGKNEEEIKAALVGMSQVKQSTTDYGYVTRPLTSHGSVSMESSQGPSSVQSDNEFTSSRPINFSSFPINPDNLGGSKTIHGNGKNFSKMQTSTGNYLIGYNKISNQGSNFRFRNQNNVEGLRSSYTRKPRARNENVCTSPYKPGTENFEKNKNEANSGYLNSSNIIFENEQEVVHFKRNDSEDIAGETNFPDTRHRASEINARNFSGNKSKVPSLFDITVEKPFGFKNSGFHARHDIWEKNEKNCFLEKKWKDREEERHISNCGTVNFPSKTVTPPRTQTWEDGNVSSQRGHEKTFVNFKNNGNRARNIEQQRVDKSELSGYVGNILARLGQCNVAEKEKKFPYGDNQHFHSNDNETSFSKETEFGENLNKNFCKANLSKYSGLRLGEGVEDESGKTSESKQIKGTGEFFPEAKEPIFEGTNSFENCEGEKVLDTENALVIERSKSQTTTADDYKRLVKPVCGILEKDFFFPKTNDRRSLARLSGSDSNSEKSSYRGQGVANRAERRKINEREEKSFYERKTCLTRDRELVSKEPVWKPQVFDYSQGRPLKISDPDEEFKISTVVDYSHGENVQTFEYRHGEGRGSRFDYGHRTESPTVIDYGHGVENSLMGFGKEEVSENGRNADGKVKHGSEEGLSYRHRSRSPHLKFKRRSQSPSFRGDRTRGKDVIGKHLLLMRRSRKNSEDQSSGENEVSKTPFDVTTVLVEDLICRPGRESRPAKLVFIMRGIPGSGKTYVTKLIKDKEMESGGDPPRILSLDDYFMTEVEKEVKDKETGRKMKSKVLEYEYEAGMESYYKGSLTKAFKKTVSDGFFSFVIVDAINEKTKDYEEMWSFAKQKGFQVYVAEMDNDVVVCTGRNIHRRTEKEISDLAKVWEETPTHYLRLDVRSLLQSDAITEVEMEVVSDTEVEKTVGKEGGNESLLEKIVEAEASEEKKRKKEEAEEEDDEEEDDPGASSLVKSRWDHLESSEQNLDRLDGLKRRREGFHETMEDYLQLPEELSEIACDSSYGKKRVRWADLEERRQQEKMRAIGFVVGQTDWNRMTDPTFGESALTRTKYI